MYHKMLVSSRGEDFAEYVLLLGFIAVLVFALVTAIGGNIAAYLNVLAQAFENVGRI